MPISSRHPEYKLREDQWRRCRDVINGADAVKARGDEYLPRLTGQTYRDYENYKKRALFFSVASRALAGLVGLMVRKPPLLKYSDEMTLYFEDYAHNGISFNELFYDMTQEVMLQSRYFVFIDWPEMGGDPYIVPAKAEQVINWSIEDSKLMWAVIEEQILKPSRNDPYEQDLVTVYRLLSLNNGIYTVSLVDDQGHLISSITPTVSGRTLDFIPGFFVTPSGLNGSPMKPLMLDIADINLAQYRNSADYESALHYVALPTPVVTGATVDGELRIGSSTAWVLPAEQAKAYFLEFQGLGLGALEKAIDTKTSQMSMFSARLQDSDARGSEAATVVKLRYMSETATIGVVANAVQSAMTQIYKWIAEFVSSEEPVIELSRDFLSSKLSAAEVTAITNAYLSGAIDKDTYFNAMQKGEWVAQEKEDFEVEPVIANQPINTRIVRDVNDPSAAQDAQEAM